jgi:S-formylglutathione hydrolase FrmB
MRNLLYLALIFFTFSAKASTVDSLDVPSTVMNKAYKAAVVLPTSYAKNQASYPVLYLLHGGGGHFRDWLTSTPDKNLVKNLADKYNLIIVMPEGETFGWYMDSPFDQNNKFETYITKEVIQKIDATYRTVKSNKGRVITGLSMGGHGAMYLSNRHPDLFGAAGTMSGAMDMNFTKFKVNADFTKSLKDRFEKLLGTSDVSQEVFVKNSIVNMVDTIKKNAMPIIIDCGVDDFLIDANRELHNRLLYAGVSHDYTERPGAHTWSYWENALPYHVLFFHNILKKNGVLVENN